jgi:hypothetical protein
MTREQLDALAATNALVAEVLEMLYMIEQPAVLDSSETRSRLAITATPINDVVTEIVKTKGNPLTG